MTKKLTIKKLPKSQIEFELEITNELLEKYKPIAYKKLAEETKIAGFRPGHIPDAIIEKHYEPEYLKAYIIDIVFPTIYVDVIKEHDLKVIAQPDVKEKSKDPLIFTVTVAVFPEITIGDYKKIKIAKKDVKVGEKEIQEVITDLQKRKAIYKKTDHPAKNDDRVEIDFEGFDEDKKSLPNTKSTNHPLLLGSKAMVSGFEDQIIGMKEGEEKEFTITFPKDYHEKNFQKKKITFKTKLNKVEECELPKIDEKFIEEISGKKQSMDEFKKTIEENLKNQLTMEVKRQREDELMQKIIDLTKIDLPDIIIEEEKKFILEDLKNRLAKQNIPYDQYLTHIKKTEKELKNEFTEEAKNRIILRLAFQKIINEEKIDIPENAIKDRINMMKNWSPEKKTKEIEKEYKKDSGKYNEMVYQMKIDRFMEMMLEK